MPDHDGAAPDTHPRAVVVVPCFNHGQFVADAVRSALHQPGAQTRVVVINDGSTDPTSAVACDSCRGLGVGMGDEPDRVLVLHQENRGLPGARNTGARAASEHGWLKSEKQPDGWGEYIVFLDADDYIEPEFVAQLAAQVRSAERETTESASPRTQVSHAYCQERLVDKAFGVWTVPEWDPVLLLITNLHPVTALIRAEWFERSGGFDESMRDGYEDWEFWIRLSELGGRGVRVRAPLFNWRRHSDVTMVIEAVARHEQLFGLITCKHADLYAKHAAELIRRSNLLLRKGDGNWLDENHEAIVVRDLRAANIDLWQNICKARAERDAAVAERTRLETLRAEYEGKPAVKVSKRLHRWLDAMGPVGRAVKGAAKAAARVLS
jgi:glycosyltransferase involved in cell wall biosynthesis